MDSVINKLTEIEQTASAIVAHAEAEKEKLDREYEEKRKVFDLRMEEETKARIERFRRGLSMIRRTFLPVRKIQVGSSSHPFKRSMRRSIHCMQKIF
mgnify:CR=1 FL=1